MHELTRKMDVLYRHFFRKWELIGKARYPFKANIKKRSSLALFDAEEEEDGAANRENAHDENIDEVVLPGRSFDTHAVRKRRIEYAEVQRKGLDLMASLAKK